MTSEIPDIISQKLSFPLIELNASVYMTLYLHMILPTSFFIVIVEK